MAVSTIQPVRGARSALSPTARTTLNRRPDRGSAERQDLYDVLDVALICHFGVVIDGSSVVLPTAFGFDPDGPDEGGTLYLHGSVASKSLQDEPQSNVCVTFTVLDGLVLARTGFHLSMNYRCAVVMGRTRKVTDPEEGDVA
ncbi:MAG: pyridoxamine 5'-phosphate oxidase family protein [Actinomycetota bacterium]|nr:pyridoxamine 5'-phosphate oxidase family protein [Actinomycetota bacterium]